MNIKLLLSILSIASTSSLISQSQSIELKQIKKYNKVVKKTIKSLNKSVSKVQNITPETPLEFWKQDYIETMDPSLGRPTPEVLFETLKKLNQKSIGLRANPGSSSSPWVSRGPNNVGGRTRALTFDSNDNTGKKVWAGGVTGGLWYNNDITSANSTWTNVSGIWANITVSCIAFDPNDSKTMYVGTGEGFGSTSSTSRGYGIFKSTDGGATWNHLSNTASYFYVNDIIVRNENGSSVLYAATDINFYGGQWNGSVSNIGLMRSTNGGSSFTNVMSNIPSTSLKYCIADLEIGADNRIWLGTRRNSGSTATDKGGGRVLYSDDGTSFTVAYTENNSLSGRVEVACSPSSKDTIYAMFESGGKVESIARSFNQGSNWSTVTEPADADQGIPSTDFTRGQAWYDLIMAVNPKKASEVIIGGINLFRSTNAGSNWTQISKWSNNANQNTLSCSYVHADQHQIVYHSDGKRVLIGGDGGVFYAANIQNNPQNSSTAFIERNNGYLVTQFYGGSMSNTKGSNLMLAGAQDNGTVYFDVSGLNDEKNLWGGDGGLNFISKKSDQKMVVSYVYNQFYGTTDGWQSFEQILNSNNTGNFINAATLDYVNDYLFTAENDGFLFRNSILNDYNSASTISFGNSSLGKASFLQAIQKKSDSKCRLFVGTGSGALLYADNAHSGTPSFTSISSGINSGNISWLHGHNENIDTLFICLSNYGVNNVYVSYNSGSSWKAIDGNLPNMPVHCILSNPYKNGEVIIGTELGIYACSDISASTPNWVAQNDGMGAVRIDGLYFRQSDGMIMVATHGRGVFTSDAWIKTNKPIAKFSISNKVVCQNETITVIDQSEFTPNKTRWRFSGGTPNFTNSTDSTSTTAKFNFPSFGNYQLTLYTENEIGSDTESINITVRKVIPLDVKIISSNNSPCKSDSILMLSDYSNLDMNNIVLNYQWYQNNTAINGANQNAYKVMPPLRDKDKFHVVVSTTYQCSNPNNLKSNVISVNLSVPTLVIGVDFDTLRPLNYPGYGQVQWFRNSVKVGTGDFFHAKNTGRYVACLSWQGCLSDSSNAIILNSVNNYNFTNKSITIYPNPNDGNFNIKSSINGFIEIWHSNGQQIIRRELESSKSTRLNLNLSSGVYLIRLFDESGMVIETSTISVSK
jgi:hypothetical protein